MIVYRKYTKENSSINKGYQYPYIREIKEKNHFKKEIYIYDNNKNKEIKTNEIKSDYLTDIKDKRKSKEKKEFETIKATKELKK